MKKKPKRPSGKSGLNLQPRRTFRATEAEFAEQDAEAKRLNITWTQLVRSVLSIYIAEQS
jgi:hypothetical protein